MAAAHNRHFASIACDDGLMRVLVPVPDRDFDVTEVAAPWRVLRDAGHHVVFATEQAGTLPAADPRLLNGVLFGQLGATAARFWATGKPVAAICHGVLVLARTRGGDGRSALASRRTTCLPKYMERVAYLTTAWRLGRYYRTYPAYVEDEVRAAHDNPGRQFECGPVTLTARGTATDDGPAFVVQDGNYLSARWPGDAYLFGRRFRDLLQSAPAR
jgi:putative intracellular protease/amidase